MIKDIVKFRSGFLLSALFVLAPSYAFGAYGASTTISNIDPSIMLIDEKRFLGAPLDKSIELVGKDGAEFTLGDLFASKKPTMVVLSYYSCDGACPTLNRLVKDRLAEIERLVPGTDYNILSISFDKNDDEMSLKMFAKELKFEGVFKENWNLTFLKNKEDIEKLTDSMGFKFYWSYSDRIFLHPSVLVFLSPKGRITRYIYTPELDSNDIELSILEANVGYSRGSKITDIKDLYLTACYSYNYQEGKYTVNYPLFIAAASLLCGVCLAVGPIIFYKHKEDKEV